MMVLYMRHIMVIVISLIVMKLHVGFNHSSHLHSMLHTMILLFYTS